MTTVLNPATEETIRELPELDAAEADAAIARAKAAFPAWRKVAPSDRARLLRTVAGLVESHLEELAAIESANVGKPIAAGVGSDGQTAVVVTRDGEVVALDGDNTNNNVRLCTNASRIFVY